MILAGDIGGTKAYLALFDENEDRQKMINLISVAKKL